MKIRIAARGSKLSLRQVDMFISFVRSKLGNDIEFEIIKVKTSGDRFSLPFEELARRGYVGLFEKEVNKAVLEGKADVAIHSLKDLSTSMSPELAIAMYMPRDSPFDVLVSREGGKLEDLPPGSIIGTSSARRKALIKNLRPDLVVKDLRGNVDTRLRKLEEGIYDAIVLAEAGLERLGLDLSYSRLDWRAFTPSPAQGIIVAVTRKDSQYFDLLNKISDNVSEEMAMLERGVLRAFGGGCHVPLGAISFIDGERVRLKATALNLDGNVRYDVEVITNRENKRIGEVIGNKLRKVMKNTVGPDENDEVR